MGGYQLLPRMGRMGEGEAVTIRRAGLLLVWAVLGWTVLVLFSFSQNLKTDSPVEEWVS